MGWRIVLQPNGRLARFSDVVDNFTHYNLGKDEALSVCVEAGCTPSEATLKVEAGKDDLACPPFVPDDGKPLKRWRAALETIAAVHGVRATRIPIAHGSQ